MRLQIRRLALVGSSREVAFEPGLNVVQGPISTGKSALMQLLPMLLGTPVTSVNPEVDSAVASLAGELHIGEQEFSVVRRLVQTDTAAIQVAGEGVALSLPASRPTKQESTTYGRWMLDQLGLPDLRVPAAPTRPEESDTTPVSIADYLSYCRLRQDEIDVDVLGSSKPFREIKRRYVFRILFGSYDAETARLQQQLRSIENELRGLQQAESSFSRFLEGTALENRAVLESQLAAARAKIEDLLEERRTLAANAKSSPRAAALAAETEELDRRLGHLSSEMSAELLSAKELGEFINQLETQSARLTRAVVAGGLLHDFDFVVCPRCGNAVSNDRGSEVTCYVCLQDVHAETRREDLLAEQARLQAQIEETQELIRSHEERATLLAAEAQGLSEARARVGRELDELLAGFVSDQASAISDAARRLAELRSDKERFEEYLGILSKLADTQQRMSELEQHKSVVTAELDRAQQLDALSVSRVEQFEAQFASLVDAFEIPEFPGEPRAGIDRTNYKPIVNGRPFEELSAGVRVLVNVAYVLALHLAAHDLSLPLPGILMIDGIQKNIGTTEYDATRMEHVWSKLVELSDSVPEDLQTIVAVNDLPPSLVGYLRLTLNHPDNRLILTEELARLDDEP
jgi:hypothetical protein